jgi:hypothetical protein
MLRKTLLFIGMLALLVGTMSACTSYKSQEVSFRPPTAYGNMQMVADAQVAAQSYADSSAAKQAFGFDIRSAGLLPVQVIIDNGGGSALDIVPEQTFLVDAEGNLWSLLDSRTAYQRVEKSSEYARIAKGSGKGSLLGGAGGAAIGAAIGILTGDNVASAAFKGAAVGAAGGAVVGGTQANTSGDASRQIGRDLASKQLVNQAVQPGSLANGFLFFPGEAPSAAQLRLQVRETQSGLVHKVMIPLP